VSVRVSRCVGVYTYRSRCVYAFWIRIYTHLFMCIQLDAYMHLLSLEERRPHPYAYARCRIFELIRHVAHCNTLQHTATHCLSQVCINVSCRTLQHTATHCLSQVCINVSRRTLQHTATHCNTLQHTATHCFSQV